MPKFNDFNLDEWKALEDIETDSLWLIEKRDNSGKHDGFYHGNFVPQIPRQLIKRYTKKGDVVFDPFMGSGTTAYETEILERGFVGVDIQENMVEYVRKKLNISNQVKDNFFELICGDSTGNDVFDKISNVLNKNGKKAIQLVILHPPYFDILKFSDNPQDLSQSKTLADFIFFLGNVIKNSVTLLEKGRYLALVMGDKYSNGSWCPLGFYCMQEAMKYDLTLKSIIVKNMEGNRAKQNKNTIWRYRALSSDYYIFKHEYVFLFKKN